MKNAAMFLYKRACILGLPVFRGRQVEAELALLHPGERVECVKTDYFVKKLSLCLTVLAAGLILGALAKAGACMKSRVGEGGTVCRGSYEEGEREVRLKTDIGKDKLSFVIPVSPRILTAEETAELAQRFFENAETLILKENEDLQHIRSDLCLEEGYEGFPFEVEWESSREEILDCGGRVGEVEEPVKVCLRVSLYYQEFCKTKELEAVVLPVSLTPEEQEYLEMRDCLLAGEESSRKKETWILPGEWKGSAVSWRFDSRDYSTWIWAATPIVVLLIYLSADRDLKKALEKKQNRLSREYPGLVHKLALYVGAGMTIRGAFQKIGGDYEKKLKKGLEKKPGCEEVLYTCRELRAGVAEGAAYEHFGKRTGLREYIRLAALLGQNLKRGSGTLLERLREEAEKSSEESLLRARKMGEEAGTKMLVPMVLMLAVVMVMIMVPAFGTM